MADECLVICGSFGCLLFSYIFFFFFFVILVVSDDSAFALDVRRFNEIVY